MKDSSTLCPYPWNHISVNPDSSMRLCCNGGSATTVFHPNREQAFLNEFSGVSEYFNLEEMKNVRKKMLAGERPSHCQACYRHEDLGGYSFRQMAIAKYSDSMDRLVQETNEDGSINPEVKYIDFAMGNNCNIKCRMCNPGNTKHIREEFKLTNPKDFTQNTYANAEKRWSDSEPILGMMSEILENADLFLFTGGEPFIIKLHYEILEKAIEIGRAPQLTLAYHTNLTVLPKRLIELWKHFEHVKIYCSLDGVGELNDFIRYPSKWQQVNKNLERIVALKQEMNVWIEVHSVFQAFNIKRVPELLKYLLKFKGQIPTMPFFNYLTYPEYFSVDVLPLDYRLAAIKDIETFMERHWDDFFAVDERLVETNKALYENFKGHLRRASKSPQGDLKRFFEVNKTMDEYRNQMMREQIPELFQLEKSVATHVACPT